MQITEHNNIPFLVFRNLTNTGIARHCFSTRKGGVSSGSFASMNLGYDRGDDKNNVDENYQRLCKAAELSIDKIVRTKQKHGTNIQKIDKMCEVPDNTDGLVTNCSNIVLATFYADCVPLLFCDPVKRVIANSHAGWRGAIENMASKTVKKMIEYYDCDPTNILIGIGPCISKENFEVDEDVAIQFKKDFPECVFPSESKPGKFHIDLREACRKNLLSANIPLANIEVATWCTFQNEALFFSHRRDGAPRGSLAAFIELI